ncbi:MAG: hypothetical protein ACOYK8_01945 [Alphaproteobacteria bacterium]
MASDEINLLATIKFPKPDHWPENYVMQVLPAGVIATRPEDVPPNGVDIYREFRDRLSMLGVDFNALLEVRDVMAQFADVLTLDNLFSHDEQPNDALRPEFKRIIDAHLQDFIKGGVNASIVDAIDSSAIPNFVPKDIHMKGRYVDNAHISAGDFADYAFVAMLNQGVDKTFIYSAAHSLAKALNQSPAIALDELKAGNPLANIFYAMYTNNLELPERLAEGNSIISADDFVNSLVQIIEAKTTELMEHAENNDEAAFASLDKQIRILVKSSFAFRKTLHSLINHELIEGWRPEKVGDYDGILQIYAQRQDLLESLKFFLDEMAIPELNNNMVMFVARTQSAWSQPSADDTRENDNQEPALKKITPQKPDILLQSSTIETTPAQQSEIPAHIWQMMQNMGLNNKAEETPSKNLDVVNTDDASPLIFKLPEQQLSLKEEAKQQAALLLGQIEMPPEVSNPLLSFWPIRNFLPADNDSTGTMVDLAHNRNKHHLNNGLLLPASETLDILERTLFQAIMDKHQENYPSSQALEDNGTIGKLSNAVKTITQVVKRFVISQAQDNTLPAFATPWHNEEAFDSIVIPVGAIREYFESSLFQGQLPESTHLFLHDIGLKTIQESQNLAIKMDSLHPANRMANQIIETSKQTGNLSTLFNQEIDLEGDSSLHARQMINTGDFFNAIDQSLMSLIPEALNKGGKEYFKLAEHIEDKRQSPLLQANPLMQTNRILQASQTAKKAIIIDHGENALLPASVVLNYLDKSYPQIFSIKTVSADGLETVSSDGLMDNPYFQQVVGVLLEPNANNKPDIGTRFYPPSWGKGISPSM